MCMEDYIPMVEQMVAAGEKVTLQTVRQKAGKGSFSTIGEAIRTVLSRGLIPAEVRGPVPESLVAEAQHLWDEACRLASATVVSERLALHSARIEQQESHRELVALADSLSLQVDALSEQVSRLQDEKQKALKRAEAAEASAKAMTQVLKEMGLKPAKPEKEATPPSPAPEEKVKAVS